MVWAGYNQGTQKGKRERSQNVGGASLYTLWSLSKLQIYLNLGTPEVPPKNPDLSAKYYQISWVW